MGRVDYSGTAAAYRRARTVPPAVLASWTAAVTGLALPRPRFVADIGAGPGGFLEPVRDWFGAPVVAVEPSAAMRDQAVEAGLTATFPYVAAAAERIPLRDAAVDVAWLSTVIHQFDDLGAAAGELRRIVAPAGHVLIRGFFGDQAMTGSLGMFPGIERSAARFPATDAVIERFARAGFGTARVVDVTERWVYELAAWIERARSIRHTDSAFRPLTDAEFEAGIQAVADAHGDSTDPVVSDTDLRLLILR